MIDAILGFFGTIVKFCYNIGGKNYLIALILFAVVVKIAMLPLSIKQQKNSIKQANLRPKEMAIRKRYAGRNDQPTQQKMQQDILDLYQKENFNPMGGCLPLLIQLPILLALYQVIIKPLQYLCKVPKDVITKLYEVAEITNKNATDAQFKLISAMKENFAKFAETAKGHITEADLPNFKFFGVDLTRTPSLDDMSKTGLVLLLVPVLTFVFMYFGMKINKKFTYNAAAGTEQDAATGCSMKIMDWMMPLMSVYITFIVPAVIGIYWIFNNIFGTIQQVILAKLLPIPQFTEEDYKRAEKEMNGKIKKEKKPSGEKKKVRSLHRIDEEDYEEPKAEAKPKKTEQAKGLAGMIEKPEVKSDEVKEEAAEEAKEEVKETEEE
ncbi:MAG: membrane protein insertase YidC [Ruminococcaceae bacterium]|nr:membrane protein insertase YidC [Oscillospiraceae bacterium]